GDDVQAVVFDLDGVLLDSEQLWDAVRRGVAGDAGRPWPAEATRAMQGMSTAEWSAYLTDVVGIPGNRRSWQPPSSIGWPPGTTYGCPYCPGRWRWSSGWRAAGRWGSRRPRRGG